MATLVISNIVLPCQMRAVPGIDLNTLYMIRGHHINKDIFIPTIGKTLCSSAEEKLTMIMIAN